MSAHGSRSSSSLSSSSSCEEILAPSVSTTADQRKVEKRKARRQRQKAKKKAAKELIDRLPIKAPEVIEVKEGETVPSGFTPLFTAEEKAAMKEMTPGQKKRFLQNRKREQALEAIVRRKVGDEATDKEVAALKEVLRAAQNENPSASGSMKTLKKKANDAIDRVMPIAFASVGEEHKEGLESFHKKMNAVKDKKDATEAARPATEVVYE